MTLSKLCSFAFVTTFIFISCGSPSGKFKDGNDTGKTAEIDTNIKFIKEHVATKWDNSWSKENVVVYHWKSEPDGLHPTNNLDLAPTKVMMDYTQRFIIGVDMEHLCIRPDLVKKLPDVSPDGLRYTYELRDEPTWDDGAQLSVDDVIFTLKAWECQLTNNGFARSSIDNLQTIETDPANPRKFIAIMKGPNIVNVNFFGDLPIMERKFHDPENVMSKYTFEQLMDPAFTKSTHPDLEKWAKEFNDPKYGRDLSKLNGLGAYKVTAWEDKQRIELTKKTNHWTSHVTNPNMYDVAYPEKIIFKINLDDNSIALEFSQQTIDASSWVSTHGLVELQKDSIFNH
ncbi:MAG TPA: ABC transporter substrate-binding protein, partial [Bacteroidia bacterium]|nr:ABC transporter substrate-binding protein [Bacteroidia bacterium]